MTVHVHTKKEYVFEIFPIWKIMYKDSKLIQTTNTVIILGLNQRKGLVCYDEMTQSFIMIGSNGKTVHNMCKE